MNEQKFWLGFWGIVAAGVVSLAGIISHYNITENEHITRMVESGANPIAVQCMLSDSMGDNPTCVLLAVDASLETVE